MKISIIIPCFNCSSTIRETIESLENQINKEFEVICINDGSTDDTLFILEDIKNQTQLDMEVYSQLHFGVSRARNYGISLAKYEYILFLDADDIYNPYFTASLKLAMDENDVDCAYCKLSRDLNNVRSKVYDPTNMPKIESKDEAMKKLLYEMGNYGFYCYLYKKKVLKENNLQFDENTKYFEDREFNWKYLCHCERFAWIDCELYGYRKNLMSVTFQEMTWEKCNNVVDAIRRVEVYLQAHDCEYCAEIKDYLFARSMWGIIKRVVCNGNRRLFKKIGRTYDMKGVMKRMKKDKERLVRLASRFYLIHPSVFYASIKMYSLLKGNTI